MALKFAPSSRVCILGGGLQGCASAYYLKRKGFDDITIVERTAVAAAASGKGGGFLARGWGSGPTTRLHEVSFDLHADLAKDLGLKSYRKISTLEVTGELGKKRRRRGGPSTDAPAWLDSADTAARLMDRETAQVVPRELCERLFEESGAKLVVAARRLFSQAAARGLEMERGDQGVTIRGLRTEGGGMVEADVFVCAMGPWSVLLEDWLADETGLSVPIEGVYSTSVVYQGTEGVAAEPFALFCAEDSNACHLECYPRVDGSVYLCGIGGSDHVSGGRLREGGDLQDATLAVPNAARVQAAMRSFSAMAPAVAAGKDPAVTQACMRPCAPDALPLLGPVPETTNLILATAHNCWGILWAPVTGKIIAELVADGEASSADISAFKPGRFQKRRPKRGRAQVQTQVGEQW